MVLVPIFVTTACGNVELLLDSSDVIVLLVLFLNPFAVVPFPECPLLVFIPDDCPCWLELLSIVVLDGDTE